ncbi:MAG TPA: glycosyltransferase family 4 protein [Solirubrobacteraceae bacterium]|jgi:glycosyltransferase involved in cell wall biosynthesis|nr:glycosyltransferase family 4 protein [Solirubrobacteraceae bacterium]
MTRSVLLVTPLWTRDGGVATHVEASAAALVRAGVDVHVLAVRDEREQPLHGVTVHTSRELFRSDVALERRFGDALSREYSVIHTHQFDEPLATAHLRRRAPLVSSVHGFSACTSGVHYFRPGQECERAHGPGCAPNLLARGCAHTRDPRWLPHSYRRAGAARASLRSADLTVTYSRAIDRHMAINGVERRAIVPLFSTVPVARGSGHETRRRVVFAGRLVRPKGVDVLIRAARAVEAEFVICGSGKRLDALRRLAVRLGVGERIDFAGWLGPRQLARQLAEASVVTIPSLWPEPFGLVGIEAFAAGRPVVASATGGVEDWLDPGRTGLSVPAGDADALAHALAELLADPQRQQAMGAAGERVVRERFTERHHVAALLGAYDAARQRWEQSGAGR